MRLATLLVTVLCLGSAEAAVGVTPVAGPASGEPAVGMVTTTAAVRAKADVDIRRIRTMVVGESVRAVDDAIARLERLGRQMRGQK